MKYNIKYLLEAFSKTRYSMSNIIDINIYNNGILFTIDKPRDGQDSRYLNNALDELSHILIPTFERLELRTTITTPVIDLISQHILKNNDDCQLWTPLKDINDIDTLHIYVKVDSSDGFINILLELDPKYKKYMSLTDSAILLLDLNIKHRGHIDIRTVIGPYFIHAIPLGHFKLKLLRLNCLMINGN